VVLYALDRDDFLAEEDVVSARLAGIPVAGARVPTV
jgi:hypothetical protein